MAVNRNTDTLSGGAPERTISRDVLVSSAQLLSMFATPVEIVPTPGANFGLVFEGAQLHKPAGTAYAGIAAGEDLTIKYTNQAGAEVGSAETTGFLDQATAQLQPVEDALSEVQAAAAFANIASKPIGAAGAPSPQNRGG